MTIGKKDILAFTVLFLSAILCVRHLYKDMSDEQLVATVDPYSLVVPAPKAVFAINRPSLFEKMVLPMENVRKAFSEHTPGIFLDVIRQNPDVPSFLLAYYPRGSVLYSPMDAHKAAHVFKQLDASFSFPPQRQEEASVTVRYYPDINKHFLGCYYHKGVLVASYNRRLLVETIERQQTYPTHVIPELAEVIGKKARTAP